MEAPAVAKPRLLSAAIAAVLAAPAAPAATISVTSNLDDGTACTLREAIANANTNSDTTSGDCTAGDAGEDTIDLTGLSGRIELASGLPAVTDDLRIDGPGASDLTVDGNAYASVFSIDGVRNVTIDALTIENGSTAVGGGGISGADATLTLTNSTVSGNSASYGGGIFAGDARLTNSTVSGNTATGYGGGGLAVYDVSLTNSTVSGNTAAGYAGYGGGISANTAVLSESTVSGNSAGSGGAGGISAYLTTLTDSIVRSNTTEGAAGGIRGSSLFLYSSTVSGNVSNGYNGGLDFNYATITDSVVADNSAAGGGGGGYVYDATLINSSVSGNSTGGVGGGLDAYYARISNSTIAGNSAAYYGGGLYSYYAATLTNSTVSGNTAGQDGGGLYAASASITNSTLWGNTAPEGYGGGFFGRTVELVNTIIADSTGGDCDALSGSVTSSLVEDGSCEVVDGVDGNIVAPPGLGVLADNGCITLAGAPAGAACVQTHALLADSPALDQGNESVCQADPVSGLDQRESPRNDGACDIGAYEAAAACGDSNGSTFVSAPDSDLCALGSPSTVDEGNTQYTWTCSTGDATDGAASCAATRNYEVEPIAGANGSIDPDNVQQVAYEAMPTFNISPDSGYVIDSVGGTCGGTLDDTTFTTDSVTQSCAVEVSFAAAVPGACGGADGVPTLTAPPLADRCSAGDATMLLGSDGGWRWFCAGDDGTEPAACSAPGAELGDGGSGTVTVETEGASCTADISPVTPPDGGPDGVTMPYGAFELTAGEACESVTINATFSGPVDDLQLYKYLAGAWDVVPGASLSGNTLSFTIEDNDPLLDADERDGYISDPFGPGAPSDEDGGGVAPIPALSGTGLLTLLAGLLGLGGFYARRR